jgi:hypothetical protein
MFNTMKVPTVWFSLSHYLVNGSVPSTHFPICFCLDLDNEYAESTAGEQHDLPERRDHEPACCQP